jgi:coenzyme F420 biosynthesis associated uncharacterized protein
MVDWDLAVTTATRLARPGPDIGRDDARTVVRELRADAARAEEHVRSFTGLTAESSTAPVVVVDRPGWVQANIDGLRMVMDPVVEKLRATKGAAGPMATAIGSRVTGVEAGGLLAFLSSRVLGQFDPFYRGADGTGGGRLLLVAPNIVAVEKELGVDAEDFRLWVCLHEETHRVQFTAVPWLRDHLLGEIESLVDRTDLDPARLAAMLRDGMERIGRLIKGDSSVSLLDLLQTPEQREIVERLTAVMSLLEGHADVVMDGVGPLVVPTVATIRERFTKRRAGAGPLDQLLRRLLGFDAKMRQYRDGAAFVRGVVAEVEMAGFNKVWDAPENLPTPGEIADPVSWVRRVHA